MFPPSIILTGKQNDCVKLKLKHICVNSKPFPGIQIKIAAVEEFPPPITAPSPLKNKFLQAEKVPLPISFLMVHP